MQSNHRAHLKRILSGLLTAALCFGISTPALAKSSTAKEAADPGSAVLRHKHPRSGKILHCEGGS